MWVCVWGGGVEIGNQSRRTTTSAYLRVCVCLPMKTSILLLILGLISVAGSETDIKRNRLAKSSLIDYTEPRRGEGALGEGALGEGADAKMKRTGDETEAADTDTKGKGDRKGPELKENSL